MSATIRQTATGYTIHFSDYGIMQAYSLADVKAKCRLLGAKEIIFEL